MFRVFFDNLVFMRYLRLFFLPITLFSLFYGTIYVFNLRDYFHTIDFLSPLMAPINIATLFYPSFWIAVCGVLLKIILFFIRKRKS